MNIYISKNTFNQSQCAINVCNVAQQKHRLHRPLSKKQTLTISLEYSTDVSVSTMDDSRRSIYQQRHTKPSKFKVKRRQTFHSQHRHGGMFSTPPMHFEVAELIRKPASNLSVPRIIPQRGSSSSSSSIAYGSTKYLATAARSSISSQPEAIRSSFLTVGSPSRQPSIESIQLRRPSTNSITSSIIDTCSSGYKQKGFLCPMTDLRSAKARIPTPELLSSDTSTGVTR